MSHLIIEQGKDVGTEVAVPQSGIKFGRSPANDLVLDDEVVMLFQGRFFFKSDGTLWVTDFSVGEKSKLDGVPIDEQQLKVGDLVEVGSSAFRIISTKREGSGVPAAAPAPESAAGEEIDLGFNPPRKTGKAAGAPRETAKHGSPIFRIMQVAVIVLVLLIVVVVATETMKSKGAGAKARREKGLSFSYECVRGDTRNIYRYSLELDRQGKATIQVDDCRSRHVSKTVQLTPGDVDTLSREIEASGFFDVQSGKSPAVAGKYDLYDIALSCNGAFSHVRVQNRAVPAKLKNTIDVLEKFAFETLDVSFTLLEDDATLIRYAQDAFKLGQERYSEKEASHGNLAKVIKQCAEAITYLETLEPKPAPYDEAMRLMEQAKAEQTAEYKDYMFNVDRAMRLSDWEEAKRNLRVLAELIPDRSDSRYATISEKQLEVEDKLR